MQRELDSLAGLLQAGFIQQEEFERRRESISSSSDNLTLPHNSNLQHAETISASTSSLRASAGSLGQARTDDADTSQSLLNGSFYGVRPERAVVEAWTKANSKKRVVRVFVSSTFKCGALLSLLSRPSFILFLSDSVSLLPNHFSLLSSLFLICVHAVSVS